MSGEIKRSRIDVIYNDILGEVGTLLNETKALHLAQSEAEGRLRAEMREMQATTEAAINRFIEATGKVEASTARSIQEEGRNAAATAIKNVMAAASEAVTHGAHQAALTAMAEPLHEMEKAYTEISQKTLRLKDLADSIETKLTIRWEKALAIALVFFVVAASSAIYLGRVLEARFPPFSEAERTTLRFGVVLQNAWAGLDERTKETIKRLGSPSPE